MFRQMDEDPFFEGFRQHHSQIEEMFKHPFGGMGMLENGGGRQKGRERGGSQDLVPRGGRSMDLEPFDDFGFGFGKVFENMGRRMRDMEKAFEQGINTEDGHAFHQTSFMSYRKDGEGAPKVFQASSSTKQGPGGVRETRKALRDSERELEKMAIGHHIRDRGHEVERRKNTRTGSQEEFQNYHNLAESDAESFDREWQEKTRQAFRGFDERRPVGRREDRRALPREEQGQRTGERLALPDSRTEHWGRSRDGGRK